MHRHKPSIDLRQQVHQFLQLNCNGHTRAIRAQDIAYKFNSSIREINDVIRDLRLRDVLIGSSKERPFGYYLPVTEDEVKYYLDTYKNELFDMLHVHNIQKRAARKTLESIKQPEFKVEHGQLAFAI
jgi:hypothetical protein